jgi:hypothetical protein
MAKPVPDSDREWQNQAGFVHDISRIKGISQLHDEGTGGSGSLGNFPIWMDKCKSVNWLDCPITRGSRTGKRVGEPTAGVGGFCILFDNGFVVGSYLFECY